MKIIEKKRLLAVDPSLTASGWVLFSIDSEQPLALGVICPPGPKHPMPERLDSLQRDVQLLLHEHALCEGDLLICEGPAPLAQNPHTAIKVERVRGIFETVGRSSGLEVPGRINPRTVQTELLGMRGKQMARAEVKDWARETASRLYGKSLNELAEVHGVVHRGRISQDVIDAVLIGTLALSRIRLCLQTGLELSSAFEVKTERSTTRSSGRGLSWSSAHGRKIVGNK